MKNIERSPSNKNRINKWESGDIAFITGRTKVEIIKDSLGKNIRVRYLENASTNRHKGTRVRKIGEIHSISRRNIYPRKRKEFEMKSSEECDRDVEL